jgi:cell division protein FtsI/penicillin-binding protein 2
VLLAQRGAILDCNGIPLAINVQVGDIDADPLAIVNPNAFAAKISPFLAGTTPQSIFAKITAAKLRLTKSGKKVRYVELAKSIESDQLNRLAAEFVSEQQLAKKTSSLPLAQRTTVDLIGYHTKP